MMSIEEADPQGQKGQRQVPGPGERAGSYFLMGTKFQFRMINRLWIKCT